MASTQLVMINVIVFLLMLPIEAYQAYGDVYLFDRISSFIAVRAGFLKGLWQPWSYLTYMFVHLGLTHLLGNMILLFFIGRIVEPYLGRAKVLAIYILGGLAGAAIGAGTTAGLVTALGAGDVGGLMLAGSAVMGGLAGAVGAAGLAVFAASATGSTLLAFQPVLASRPGIAAASLVAPPSVTLLCQRKIFFSFFSPASFMILASVTWVP